MFRIKENNIVKVHIRLLLRDILCICFSFDLGLFLYFSKMKVALLVRYLMEKLCPQLWRWFLFRRRFLFVFFCGSSNVWTSITVTVYFSYFIWCALCCFAFKEGMIRPRGVLPKIILLEAAEPIFQLRLSDLNPKTGNCPELFPSIYISKTVVRTLVFHSSDRCVQSALRVQAQKSHLLVSKCSLAVQFRKYCLTSQCFSFLNYKTVLTIMLQVYCGRK